MVWVETFGGELLVIAKKNGFRIGEVTYEPPPRRSKPRIGGTIRANLRIFAASVKCFILFFSLNDQPLCELFFF